MRNNPLTRFKSVFIQNLLNIPGWKTDRKILVIESDDWGSIRMPSVETYKSFISKGFNISGSRYNRLDTLETDRDLEMLYDVLDSVRDSEGNPAVLTSNFVVGNPDFKRIRESDFNEYFFEPVTTTLKRYRDRNRLESLWQQGISSGVFHPQFHGREHVNVIRWMNALKKKTPEIMYTFDNETTFSGNGDYNFMEVLDYNSPDDLIQMKESLAEGMVLFEKIFGYKSKSFIPPCYTWNSEIEKTLKEGGVNYLQGIIVQQVPTGSFENYKRKYHYLGKQNSIGQYYLIRNCFFEPSLSDVPDLEGECMRRINIAFRWKKPAVLCSHRINFMGSLDEKNRNKNLLMLKDLLLRIKKTWPEIEFMTSDQLGDLIDSKKPEQ